MIQHGKRILNSASSSILKGFPRHPGQKSLNAIRLFNSGFSLYDCGLMMIGRDDFDPLAPQREAAMFYGLFLRGHSAESLRKDIDVPKPVLDKWLQPRRYEDNFRDNLRRMYTYRKKVLAIFDELVLKEKFRLRVH
jgi:hypothetical protein